MGPKSVADFKRDHPVFFERGKKRFHRDKSYHTWRGHLIIEKMPSHPSNGEFIIYHETWTSLHVFSPRWLDPPYEHPVKSLAVAREIIDRALGGELQNWFIENYPDYEGSQVAMLKTYTERNKHARNV